MTDFGLEKLYSAADIAEILGVSRGQATKIMLELPHADVGGSPSNRNKFLRITETTLTGYLNGTIKRTPWAEAEAAAEEKARAKNAKKAPKDPLHPYASTDFLPRRR